MHIRTYIILLILLISTPWHLIADAPANSDLLHLQYLYLKKVLEDRKLLQEKTNLLTNQLANIEKTLKTSRDLDDSTRKKLNEKLLLLKGELQKIEPKVIPFDKNEILNKILPAPNFSAATKIGIGVIAAAAIFGAGYWLYNKNSAATTPAAGDNAGKQPTTPTQKETLPESQSNTTILEEKVNDKIGEVRAYATTAITACSAAAINYTDLRKQAESNRAEALEKVTKVETDYKKADADILKTLKENQITALARIEQTEKTANEIDAGYKKEVKNLLEILTSQDTAHGTLIEKIQKEIQSLQKDHTTTSEKNEALKKVVDEHTTGLVQLTATVENIQKQQKETNSKQESEIQEIRAQLTKAQERIKEAENRLNEQLKANITYNEHFTQLNSDKILSKTTIKQHEQNLKELSDSIASLKKQEALFQETLKSKNKAIMEIRVAQGKTDDKLEAQAKTLLQQTKDLEALQANLTQQEAANQSIYELKETLEQTLQTILILQSDQQKKHQHEINVETLERKKNEAAIQAKQTKQDQQITSIAEQFDQITEMLNMMRKKIELNKEIYKALEAYEEANIANKLQPYLLKNNKETNVDERLALERQASVTEIKQAEKDRNLKELRVNPNSQSANEVSRQIKCFVFEKFINPNLTLSDQNRQLSSEYEGKAAILQKNLRQIVAELKSKSQSATQ